MIAILLCVTTLLTGCGWFGNDNKPGEVSENPRFAELRAKRGLYCDLSKDSVMEKGFAVSKCDGLLFTTLHQIACGTANIDAFEKAPGLFTRSPQHDCFIPPSTDNGANSTISKDMFTGLMLYMAKRRRDDMAKRVVDYCADNKVLAGAACKIGEAADSALVVSKTYLPFTSVNMIKDIYENGPPPEDEAAINLEVIPKKVGFLAHLEVLGELVRGLIYGGISDKGVERLKKQRKREPRNAIYTASSAYYENKPELIESALNVMFDESLFPKDKLPTSANYCTDYLFQRDESTEKDWVPCEKNKTHDGTDFVFAASIVLGELLP